jgi:TIR domain
MSAASFPGAPFALAGRYVRFVTGFSVGVGIGLAFYLGKINVPGFAALLEAIPFQLRDALVPLSTFLVGLIAVFVQFYAGEAMKEGRIRSLFAAGMATVVTGFILFTLLDALFVTRQKFGEQTVGVVTAATRLPGCECGPQSKVNDKACIQQLSLAEDALASCWGGRSLQLRELSLSLTYLLLIGGFAWLVGLLLLRDEARRWRPGLAAGAARAGLDPAPSLAGNIIAAMPPKVFLSYSHVDGDWKQRLAGHLRVLNLEGLLEVWEDGRIGAGSSWEADIRTAMSQARVAVLLVSKDFLTSAFVRSVEAPFLLEQRARGALTIVPVIVHSCPWRSVEWLASLEVRPRGGEPLSSYRGDRVNRELTLIAEEIRDLLRPGDLPLSATGRQGPSAASHA